MINNDDFYKTIYAIMISLKIPRLDIDECLIEYKDMPAMYVSYNTKTKKYSFICPSINEEKQKSLNDFEEWVDKEMEDIQPGKATYRTYQLEATKDIINDYKGSQNEE